jgi:hypothetical protein
MFKDFTDINIKIIIIKYNAKILRNKILLLFKFLTIERIKNYYFIFYIYLNSI